MKDSKDYYGLAPGKSVLLRYAYIVKSSLPVIFFRSALYTENSFCWCRYAFPIKCTEVILADDKETILEIRAEYDPSKKTKPKVHCCAGFPVWYVNLHLSTTKLIWCWVNALVNFISFFLVKLNIMQGVLHWVAAPSPGVDPLMVEVRLFDKLFLSEVGKHQLSNAFLFPSIFFIFEINSYLCFYCWIRTLLNLMIGLLIWTHSPKWWFLVHMPHPCCRMLQLGTNFSLKGLVDSRTLSPLFIYRIFWWLMCKI